MSDSPPAPRRGLWRSARRATVRAFDAVAGRRRVAVVLVGLLAAGGAALRCALDGLPVPVVHDEFSYLLGADTFARGRLTNPPLPLWQAFETIHVLQQPTYSSKYPPGQALFLAGGKVLGHPVVGVWLSLGLACAALCWMLQGWLIPRWALVGALAATARITFGGDPYFGDETSGRWAHGYMGGAVAMLGGCLVYGAYPRLTTRPRPRHGFTLGLGLVLLAYSRPFEGLVVSLPVAGALAVHLCGPRRPAVRVLPGCLVPFVLALAGGFGFLLAHNRAVTGNPLLLPYMEHARQYEPVPVFLFQPLRPEPEYRHASIKELHADWATEVYQGQLTWLDRGEAALLKVSRLWQHFLGPGLTVPLLVLPWVLCRRGVPLGLAGVGVLLLALCLICVWSANHYAAPATGALYLVVARCLQRLSLCRAWGFRWGRWVVALVLVWVWVALPAWRLGLGLPDLSDYPQVQRKQLAERLAAAGGGHLVVVRYAPNHSAHFEWVYNGADLAREPVVWVHDMGPEWYGRLREHFPGRSHHLLHADENPPRLEPLP